MMRLRLKNTFVEVDMDAVADTCVAGSSPCLSQLGGGNGRSPTATRSRSAEVDSPSRPFREVRTSLQMDRLNNILVGCQRPDFREHGRDGVKDTGACGNAKTSCPSVTESEEAVASSACSTGFSGVGGLKRQVWSFDFSSTAPSDLETREQREYSHKDVPRRSNFQVEPTSDSDCGNRDLPTTLMIRNIPNCYSQQDLFAELQEHGFSGLIDFLYMPRDKSAKACIGYAFVNFADGASAGRCVELLLGHRFRRHGKCRNAVVSVAHLQGLEANRAHYEKSAVNSSRIARHRPLFLTSCSQDQLPHD